uniref:Transmembrane protein 42-like n=1 Tax=Astyanax mexicanus TaxID=7994 RepID=A0A3B1JJI2_ASTMX
MALFKFVGVVNQCSRACLRKPSPEHLPEPPSPPHRESSSSIHASRTAEAGGTGPCYANNSASPRTRISLHIPLRLLCGGLLFTCNAVMWTFLSKALRYSSSSTRTTVTTTASNFISSAFLGQLIFGDSHIALWWVGISLTLSGLLVLHRASPSETSHEDEIKRTRETARGPERAEKPA